MKISCDYRTARKCVASYAYYAASGSEAMEVNFKDEPGKIKEGAEYWFYENKKIEVANRL
ncbi:MAG: hypothetical protein NVSMB45_13630 [Ginsengibacter sp.]